MSVKGTPPLLSSPSSQRFSRDLSYGSGPDSNYNLLQTLATESGYGSAYSIRSACSQHRYSGLPIPQNADLRRFSVDLYNYESPSNRSSLSFNSALLGRLSSRLLSLPLSPRLPRRPLADQSLRASALRRLRRARPRRRLPHAGATLLRLQRVGRPGDSADAPGLRETHPASRPFASLRSAFRVPHQLRDAGAGARALLGDATGVRAQLDGERRRGSARRGLR